MDSASAAEEIRFIIFTQPVEYREKQSFVSRDVKFNENCFPFDEVHDQL